MSPFRTLALALIQSPACALLAGCASPADTKRHSTGFTSTPVSRNTATAGNQASALPAQPVAKEIEPFIPFGTLEEHLKSVDLKNGVGAGEASILATAYFTRFDGLCGAVYSLRRDPAAWRAFTLVGPSGVPGTDILIEVCTGAISQRNHPTIQPPWSELRVIQEIYDGRMAPPSNQVPTPE